LIERVNRTRCLGQEDSGWEGGITRDERKSAQDIKKLAQGRFCELYELSLAELEIGKRKGNTQTD
jgi:hypothetical protein